MGSVRMLSSCVNFEMCKESPPELLQRARQMSPNVSKVYFLTDMSYDHTLVHRKQYYHESCQQMSRYLYNSRN